ncbi:unnamed protein product, partial [Scytosiphon promiscuus]
MSHLSPATATVDCDFLIVGAGSSGCVLASRLVRAGLKVLLIEKGPADASTLSKLVRRPSEWMRQASSGKGLSEAFMTVPQAGLGNRRLPAFRGRGGGGTSNVNSGFYQRGREKDYDEHWPWEVKDIEASFKSIEAELTLEELRSTSTIAAAHNRILEEIGLQTAPPLPSSATDIDGYTEPTWTREGIGGCPMKFTTTRGAERQSAWAAFVKPVTTMPNLKVKDDATVTRVIIEGGRAVGVEILESFPRWWGGRGTRVRQLRLAKERAEIVLCCGVFRSPKLLMLSGVGPRKHLEEKGVSVLVDLPNVGENLQDHFLFGTMNLSKPSLVEADFIEGSWHCLSYFSRDLPPSTPPPPLPLASRSSSNSLGDSTTTDNAAYGTTEQKMPSSSLSATAVVGLAYSDGSMISRYLAQSICLMLTQPGLSGAFARAIVRALCWVVTWLTPVYRILRNTHNTTMFVTTIKSKGTVRLASGTDPSAAPLIDPGYFSHPQDRETAREAWRLARRAKETPTSKALCGLELMPGKRYNFGEDDKSATKYIRDNCLPYFHPIGTCRMGKGVEDSVVSADDLRVHGVSGLRVADASVAPHIPATPTQAMCMMIGDRAAALALGDRFAKEQIQVRQEEERT